MARAHNARAEDVSAQSKPWRNATRQAIHLTVAAVDDCGYCQAAYTGATRAASFEVDETVQIRRGRLEDDPELNALLALVRQIADNLGYVDESEWSAALAAGWTTDSTSRPPPSRSRSVLLTAYSIMVAPRSLMAAPSPLPARMGALPRRTESSSPLPPLRAPEPH